MGKDFSQSGVLNPTAQIGLKISMTIKQIRGWPGLNFEVVGGGAHQEKIVLQSLGSTFWF